MHILYSDKKSFNSFLLKMNLQSSVLSFVLLVSGFVMNPVLAQPSLTPEDARSFIDFYYNGQGSGIVLADMQLCTEIVENQCDEPVSPIALQMGVTYNVWMMYVVPQGDEIEGLLVHFNHGGLTRITRELSVKGSIRYRTWRAFTPNRPGNWEIMVLYDTGSGVQTLKTLTVTVNE